MSSEEDDLTQAMREVAALMSAVGGDGTVDTGDLDREAWLNLRARVGHAVGQFYAGARAVDIALGLPSAASRLREYLVLHLGEEVTGDALSGVAGTHEWARRMRELEHEEGWSIATGPTDGIKVGSYRLDSDVVDGARASVWRTRNEIRRREGSANDRLLAYLQEVYPASASKEDLIYVSKISEWPRRMRELEEQGWDVISSANDPLLPPGSYRLGSLAIGPARSRRAIKQRVAVLRRDDWSCRDCGASRTSDPKTLLQIHHVHQVMHGGDNADDNLVTLCRPCHAGRHAISGDDLLLLKDELLDPAADLGPERAP